MPLTRVLRLALHRFDALTDALTQYGQERLGCRTISPPWLSFYIDGCEQQVQADFGDPSRTRTRTRTRTLTLTRTAGARGRPAGPAGVRALSHAMGGGQLTLTLTRAPSPSPSPSPSPNPNPPPSPGPSPSPSPHPKQRAFTGGETTIMQPHVLDYWRAS